VLQPCEHALIRPRSHFPDQLANRAREIGDAGIGVAKLFLVPDLDLRQREQRLVEVVLIRGQRIERGDDMRPVLFDR
jgi:hypothetical protein